MNAAVSHFEIKGWCPGALRPMESGDGLIVRVRPRAPTLSSAELKRIAAAAEKYGNGYIDLTRRANLQIRGVTVEKLASLQVELRALGMMDETAEAERIRNIIVSPLAGFDPFEAMDMRPLAVELAKRLAASPADWALPEKFAFVLDGGGRLRLDDQRADIRLFALTFNGQRLIAVARGCREWLGMSEPENVISAVIAILNGKVPRLQPVETLNVQKQNNEATLVGVLKLSAEHCVIGLGVPFGRLEANQLRVLSEAAPEIRLSPWRVLYAPLEKGATGEDIMDAACEAGLITDVDDPLMRVQACPGHPACRAGYADTRTTARKIAQWMKTSGFEGTAHVSGCVKGCASSTKANIMLVGTFDGYRFMRNASARDSGGNVVSLDDIPAAMMQWQGDPGRG